MESNEQMIQSYIEQLTEKEKTVYLIAIQKLETSFDIEKSIGYKEWLTKTIESKSLPTMETIPSPPINFPPELCYLWSKVYDDSMPMTQARIMHKQLMGD